MGPGTVPTRRYSSTSVLAGSGTDSSSLAHEINDIASSLKRTRANKTCGICELAAV